MSDSIIVRVTLDAYDMASTGRQTQVYVQIPEVARVSWLLPEDRFHGLVDRAWPEVLDVTHDYVTYGGAASNSSTTAAWKAVMEWLRDDANRDEVQAAWEEHEARRNPVARKLLARVAELRAERAARQDEVSAAVGYTPGLKWPDLVGIVAANTASAVQAERDVRALRKCVAELEAERHSTNESLSEAAEQLRANRDRITELETLAGQATEFRLWEPGYGLYIRRAPGAAGFGVLEARRTDKGRRCWTTSGWQYSAVLTDTELFCWPDASTAVTEARRVMPGAVVREVIAEAQHAHNTAPGPDTEEPRQRAEWCTGCNTDHNPDECGYRPKTGGA